eukprot:TRINITY_DN7152_c0_g1_i1.p3 TRINITY_DN7152_c0_g1~~TRINITY_DN7152_c0_g1_i1.p3  ORF type:complete len:318 (+),score=144.80 TRINITY_DN7152_c0_g1_i1:1175-2128(+)
MLIILSPAKTMRPVADLMKEAFWKSLWARRTAPRFPKTTQKLLKEMLTLEAPQLAKVLEISAALAKENRERYINWDKADAAPAAVAFDGPAYKGLQAGTLSEEEVEYLQKHLRIVDPLHGMLRPLDAIKPYRLEMKTKKLELLSGTKGGLAKYWSEELTKSLIADLDEQEAPEAQRFILDVASQEYSKVLDHKLLAAANVKVFTMGIEGSTFDAKFGRGCAARYCARVGVATPEDLVNFTGAEDGSKTWAVGKRVEGKSMSFAFKGKGKAVAIEKAAPKKASPKKAAPKKAAPKKAAPKAAKRKADDDSAPAAKKKK